MVLVYYSGSYQYYDESCLYKAAIHPRGGIYINKYDYLFIRIIEMFIGVSITAMGLSFMIKSGMGQTSITAFTQNITMITGLRSGTVLIVFFLTSTFLQLLILRRDFQKIQLLQIAIALLQGKIVNLICYDIPIVSDYFPQSYWEQLLFILVGIFLASFGVAMLFKAELVRNPFEELAMVLSQKLKIEFSIFRTRVDIFFMVVSLVMILIFKLDFTTIREGTWISMLLLGRSMKYTFPLAQKSSLYCRKMERLKI